MVLSTVFITFQVINAVGYFGDKSYVSMIKLCEITMEIRKNILFSLSYV
jgi:hypothetical protein